MGLCLYNIAFVLLFDRKYTNQNEISSCFEILTIKIETQNYNKYVCKNKKNDKFIIYSNEEYFPGDVIYIDGVFSKAEEERNYKGFNYRNYLKQNKIYGIIIINEERYINSKKDIYYFRGIIVNNFKCKIEKDYSKDSGDFLKGILLGNKDNLNENIISNFRNSSISHVLAISGLHITYVILGLKKIINKIISNRKTQNLCLIVFLSLFPFLTGNSPSCIRACIMNIMILISENFYKKNSFYMSFLISFIILLIINPYNIYNIGMWLSYLGTLGIVLCSDLIFKIIYRKTKLNNYFAKSFSISLSVQIFVLPIIIYSFNTISFSFFIPNLFISWFIGPVLILGYISLCIPSKISIIIVKINEIFIKIIFAIANICSKIPLSKIYLQTPNFIIVVFYYICLFIFIFLFHEKKFYYLKCFISAKILKNKIKRIVLCILAVVLISNINLDRSLKIFFVDVGQGDCCLIKTPCNKSILIDGGEDFDGKIVLPYLLDRGVTKIDYIIISHFDSDHVGGILSVIKELNVRQILISKQQEESENYYKFKEIVKEKNIKVIIVSMGNRINIEKDIYIDILWPGNSKQITDNIMNNNSIVCKFNYKRFSILFTGDIEEIAEKKIIQEYKHNIKILNSTILKVAHHRFKNFFYIGIYTSCFS